MGQSVYVSDATDLAAQLDTGYAAWAEVSNNPFYIPELSNYSTAPGEMTALLQGLSGYDRLVAATYTDFQSVSDFYGLPRLGDGAEDWSVLSNPLGFTNSVTVTTETGPSELGSWYQSSGRVVDPTEFRGTDGNDVLIGQEQNDRLIGGAGDDIYLVDSADDRVIEAADGGNDQVLSTVSLTLDAGVEGVELLGTAALSVLANDLDNMIIGNDAANTVNGLGGQTSSPQLAEMTKSMPVPATIR